MTVRLSASQPGATFKGNCICIACSIIEQLPASAFYSTNCLGLLLLHKDQLVVDQCSSSSSSSNYILIHCFVCFFVGFLVEAVNPLSNAPGVVGSFANPVTSSAKVLTCSSSSSSQGYQPQQQQVTFHSSFPIAQYSFDVSKPSRPLRERRAEISDESSRIVPSRVVARRGSNLN